MVEQMWRGVIGQLGREQAVWVVCCVIAAVAWVVAGLLEIAGRLLRRRRVRHMVVEMAAQRRRELEAALLLSSRRER